MFIWPGSMLHHLKTLRTPRFEHYDIEYVEEGNCWAFLGNGRTELEVLGEGVGNDPEKVVLAPYIRNQDVEWSLDVDGEMRERLLREAKGVGEEKM